MPAISIPDVAPEIGAGVIAACAVVPSRPPPSTTARTARVFIESLQF
jgi:hypothetical protein